MPHFVLLLLLAFLPEFVLLLSPPALVTINHKQKAARSSRELQHGPCGLHCMDPARCVREPALRGIILGMEAQQETDTSFLC